MFRVVVCGTYARRSGAHNNNFTINLVKNLTVKECWKSVKIWQNYGYEFGVHFWPTMYSKQRFPSARRNHVRCWTADQHCSVCDRTFYPPLMTCAPEHLSPNHHRGYLPIRVIGLLFRVTVGVIRVGVRVSVIGECWGIKDRVSGAAMG